MNEDEDFDIEIDIHVDELPDVTPGDLRIEDDITDDDGVESSELEPGPV